MSDSEDDDTPQLSSHTLAALQEFYAEQKQHADPSGDDKYNIGIIEENWVSKYIPRPSGISGIEPVLFQVQCLIPPLIPKSITCHSGDDHYGEQGQKAFHGHYWMV